MIMCMKTSSDILVRDGSYIINVYLKTVFFTHGRDFTDFLTGAITFSSHY